MDHTICKVDINQSSLLKGSVRRNHEKNVDVAVICESYLHSGNAMWMKDTSGSAIIWVRRRKVGHDISAFAMVMAFIQQKPNLGR